MVAPARLPDGAPAVLSSVIDGPAVIGLSVESVAPTIAPAGEVPATEAVLSTWPLSTSAWVSV